MAAAAAGMDRVCIERLAMIVTAILRGRCFRRTGARAGSRGPGNKGFADGCGGSRWYRVDLGSASDFIREYLSNANFSPFIVGLGMAALPFRASLNRAAFFIGH